jgi:predicted transcriptional regulator
MLVKAPAADRKLLTPNRLALLRAIRTERRGFTYALARRVGRDLKNVQRDLRLLDGSGLAEDEEERIELALAARAAEVFEDTGLYILCAVLDPLPNAVTGSAV